VRAIGPIATALRNDAAGAAACKGWCETCVTLPAEAEISRGVELVSSHLLARLGPRDLARRWGAGAHAELVELGWRGCGE
jgi:hypothetical protein